jgi:hypothetical protein
VLFFVLIFLSLFAPQAIPFRLLDSIQPFPELSPVGGVHDGGGAHKPEPLSHYLQITQPTKHSSVAN